MTKLNENPSLKIDQSFKQTDWLANISNMTSVPRKDVEKVLKSIPDIIAAHLQKDLVCSLLGLFKLHTVEKDATPEREVLNPFSGKPMTIPAKPRHKVVRVKALKKLKEMVGDAGEEDVKALKELKEIVGE